MINFRYHVVSLTSVFLALAIGLVLGTTALNGPLADNFNNQVSSLHKTNGQLRDQVREHQARVDSQDEFVRTVGPTLLTGRLKNHSVLMVTDSGTQPEERDGVIALLEQAGAVVTGRVRINEDFTDGRHDEMLQDLATKLVPAGMRLPNNGVGVETASALLATALMGGGSAMSDASRTSILSGFSRLGVLTVESHVTRPAEAVVVVTGPSKVDVDSAEQTTTLMAILAQFDRATRYMVVAAPTASGNPSILATVRNDNALGGTVSTVDGVTLAEGQVVTVLALVEQFSGRSGHYGIGEGATARVPLPKS